jgi:hypothetical protein
LISRHPSALQWPLLWISFPLGLHGFHFGQHLFLVGFCNFF